MAKALGQVSGWWYSHLVGRIDDMYHHIDDDLAALPSLD